MTSPKYIFASLMIAASSLLAPAQTYNAAGLGEPAVDHSDNKTLKVTYQVNPSEVKLGLNRRMVVTPMLTNAERTDSVILAPYIIAGRNQYYYTLRGKENIGRLYRSGDKTIDTLTETVAWQDWMGHGEIDFVCNVTSCCDKPEEHNTFIADLDLVPPVIPIADDLRFITPQVAESKEFKIEGRAYVNFRVNKTVIDPYYMNNLVELAKITNSIDSVKNNPDATIKSITLTGYASPEGPYNNNVRLAEGRTRAVREYCNGLYHFPEGVFVVKSVPEDWEGLIDALAVSAYPKRDEMISFIRSDYPIEKRNDRFRQLFPAQYPSILNDIYPSLRHTDYLINYTIKKYTDINEIARVLVERPQNLSINELYLLGASYPIGSPEYCEVFETAAVMFPDEAIANINAANAALLADNVVSAEKYLRKAGNSPDADFARGMYYAKLKDYPKAKECFEKCNTPAAQNALKRIAEIENFVGTVKWRE